MREDKNLRGREPGESAANVIEGIDGRAKGEAPRERPREKILDEHDRRPRGARRGEPGRPRRVCVDDAVARLPQAMARGRRAAGAVATGRSRDPGELTRVPRGLGACDRALARLILGARSRIERRSRGSVILGRFSGHSPRFGQRADRITAGPALVGPLAMRGGLECHAIASD